MTASTYGLKGGDRVRVTMEGTVGCSWDFEFTLDNGQHVQMNANRLLDRNTKVEKITKPLPTKVGSVLKWAPRLASETTASYVLTGKGWINLDDPHFIIEPIHFRVAWENGSVIESSLP
jgi:hypothetical protein